MGRCPQPGERISAQFSLPPARRADRALTLADLTRGLVFVSTLPNIAKQACTAQVVALDHALRTGFADARAVHVPVDGAERWAEVDAYHPDVDTPAYPSRARAPRAARPSRASSAWASATSGASRTGSSRCATAW